MPPFITLDGLGFRTLDGRTLFEDLTLTFGRERTGIVGPNGCGKTTLLRLIGGELEPAAGAVSLRGRTGLLRQALAPRSVDSVADLLGVTEDLARLARIECGEGTVADLDRAVWDVPAVMESVLTQVGLGGLDPARPAASLSGGEATRAALARLLIARPDVLLLDEPTNNLDVGGRGMVCDVLNAWKGGAVVVSHDRGLLRGLDRIVEISGVGVQVYGGGYDLFRARKTEAAEAAARRLDMAKREARRIDRDVQATRERQDRRDSAGRRLKAKGGQPRIMLNAMAERAEGTRAGQNHLAERRRLEAASNLAEARALVDVGRKLDFALPGSGLAAGRAVLTFEAVGFAWPGRAPLFEALSFKITGSQRLAVTGPNGSGKSTLIGLATAALRPDGGRVTQGVAAVVLDQRAALLRDDQTLIDNYRRINPEADDNSAHTALARFLFRNVSALKQARELSGGERLRAALACVLMGARPAQFIILDEPTNHLDLDSIHAVEVALTAYDGALMAVSHDEDFLTAIGIERRLRLGPTERGRRPGGN